MKLREIEKVIDNHLDGQPIGAYFELCMKDDFKLTKLEFIAIACKYLYQKEETKDLAMKWLEDMAYSTGENIPGVCLIFPNGYYPKDPDPLMCPSRSLGFAKETKEYLIYPNTHIEEWPYIYYTKPQKFNDVPKGEIVYRKKDNTYLIFYDAPLFNLLRSRIEMFEHNGLNYELHEDEQFDRLKYGG